MPKRRRHRHRGFEDDPLGADIQESADRIGREAARLADQVNSGIHRMSDAFDDEMRRREGYAYHAGEAGPGPNQHRLYRNMRRGKIAGVCAGLADYFGVKVKWLRIGGILATVFFFPFPIIAYGVAAVVMKRPSEGGPHYRSAEDERFWRNYSVRPKTTYGELRHRFRALETRVEQMEYAVTSNEFGLRKQFQDLERGV